MHLDRVVELKLALVPQHHERGAGDRLGHGEDAEDGVCLHGHLIFDVLIAHRLGHQHLAVLRDHDDRAGQLTRVDP